MCRPVSTNRCVGYEIAMMDEHRIFIENKADHHGPRGAGADQIRQIKSGIDYARRKN